MASDIDFERLKAFIRDRYLQVIIAWRADSTSDWQVRRLPVVPPLGDRIRTTVLRGIDSLARRSPDRYVEGWTPDLGTYAVMTAAEVDGPLVSLLLDSYSATAERDLRPTDEPEPEPDADPGEALRARVLGLVARADDQKLALVRAQNPVYEMAPDRVTAIVRGSRLSEARRIFTYDGRIDVMIWNGQAIVLNAVVLENLLRSPVRLAAELADAVAAFDAHPLFGGVEALATTAAHDSNFARGVRRVHKAGHLEDIDAKQVRDSIVQWGHETVSVSAEERLQFEPHRRWDFLRLIDDGYLTSDLTGIRYEVNSKRPWPRVHVSAVERDNHGRIVRLHGPGRWSPRSLVEALDDIDRGQRQYFIVADGKPHRITTQATPDGRTLRAMTADGECDLLPDAPAPA